MMKSIKRCFNTIFKKHDEKDDLSFVKQRLTPKYSDTFEMTSAQLFETSSEQADEKTEKPDLVLPKWTTDQMKMDSVFHLNKPYLLVNVEAFFTHNIDELNMVDLKFERHEEKFVNPVTAESIKQKEEHPNHQEIKSEPGEAKDKEEQKIDTDGDALLNYYYYSMVAYAFVRDRKKKEKPKENKK